LDENLKNRLLLILGVFVVFLMFTTANSCNSARTEREKRQREVAQRLDSEEKADVSQKQLTTLQDKLKDTETKLMEAAKELDGLKKQSVQEQMVNESLKTEIDKLSKLKEALEADLKEALVGKIPAKPKK
jgi:septal ring factor EnvC (AmiA/AmiB activator)